MSISTHHYLMICGNGYNELGEPVEPYDVLKHRLHNSYWPIYSNTRNRKTIKESDQLAFYVSGNKEFGGMVVAVARAKEILIDQKRLISYKNIENEVSMGENFYSIVKLDGIDLALRKTIIKQSLKHLSFGKENMKKWGALLQGGCRKLTEEDFLLLTKSSPD